METTDQEQKEETALKNWISPSRCLTFSCSRSGEACICTCISLVIGETASDVEKSAMSLLTQPSHVNEERNIFGREKLHFVIADLELKK